MAEYILNPKVLALLKTAETAEDVKSLMEENGISLSIEYARKLLNFAKTSGEIPDDELDTVAGGFGPAAPSFTCAVCRQLITDPMSRLGFVKNGMHICAKCFFKDI